MADATSEHLTGSAPQFSTDLDAALDRCRRPAEAAHALPAELYRSDALLAQEQARVLRRSWLGVGRADRLSAPGDMATLDFAGHALILVRDRDGRLRAFANACRHRGARLVDGDGAARGFRCPFHSWAYSLDGRLVAAPHMERAEGFDRADYGLIAYRVEERAGFAFVALSDDAPDPDAAFAGFDALHAPWRFSTLRSVRRRVFEVDCNWKAFLEVFNEYYHLPFVHPSSINSVYAAPDAADTVSGAFASQFGATDGTGALLAIAQDQALPPLPGLTGRALSGARYTWLFPNMTFAAGRDALWVYEAYPLTAGRCLVAQTICFPPETMAIDGFDAKAAAYFERLDAALDEDAPALVNQQRGLASLDAETGRLQPDLEPNVAAFAAWYAERWRQAGA